MPEHVHEWRIGFDENIGGALIICDVEGCNESLDIDQAESMLNEYEILLWDDPTLKYMVERSKQAYALKAANKTGRL